MRDYHLWKKTRRRQDPQLPEDERIHLEQWIRLQREDYALYRDGEYDMTFLFREGFEHLSRLGFDWSKEDEAKEGNEAEETKPEITDRRSELYFSFSQECVPSDNVEKPSKKPVWFLSQVPDDEDLTDPEEDDDDDDYIEMAPKQAPVPPPINPKHAKIQMQWEELHQKLKAFHKRKGHVNVPLEPSNPTLKKLHHWVKNQKMRYIYTMNPRRNKQKVRPLTPSEHQKLAALNVIPAASTSTSATSIDYENNDDLAKEEHQESEKEEKATVSKKETADKPEAPSASSLTANPRRRSSQSQSSSFLQERVQSDGSVVPTKQPHRRTLVH